MIVLKKQVDVLLGVLDTLLLPDCYKTKHLLKIAADLPTADLLDYIPNFVRSPEPVFLNTVNVQPTFLPFVDVRTWCPDDDNPGYHKSRMSNPESPC